MLNNFTDLSMMCDKTSITIHMLCNTAYYVSQKNNEYHISIIILGSEVLGEVKNLVIAHLNGIIK